MATQDSQNTRPGGIKRTLSDTEFLSTESEATFGEATISRMWADRYERVFGISGLWEAFETLTSSPPSSYVSARSTYGSNGSYLSARSTLGSARSYWSARSSHLHTTFLESNELSELPEWPGWPEGPEWPGWPKLPELPELPEWPKLPELPELPESPKASPFASKLMEKGILQPPDKELDWSGRGQHVEYNTQNSKEIPLERLDELGFSATALVESVRCTRGRRVKMARKSIRCSRKMTMDEVLVEVEALQKLNHPHVIQLVGSYLLEDRLSILLYPVADCHLGTFMQRYTDLSSLPPPYCYFLGDQLMGCLTQAVLYVHSKNFKHGDIKPQNILIRYETRNDTVLSDSIRLYLSDFGIARKFKDESYTKDDSVTALSKIYCAPEVYNGEPWGRSADLFSLGCVLSEMELAFNHSKGALNDFIRAREAADCPFAPGSYFGNLDLVRERISTLQFLGVFHSREMLLALLEEKPEYRVISHWLKDMQFDCCRGPRETYEFDES